MKLKELLMEGTTPDTVVSGIASYDLKKGVSALKKAGFKASVYSGEYIGVSISGDYTNDSTFKSAIGKVLKDAEITGYDISE